MLSSIVFHRPSSNPVRSSFALDSCLRNISIFSLLIFRSDISCCMASSFSLAALQRSARALYRSRYTSGLMETWAFSSMHFRISSAVTSHSSLYVAALSSNFSVLHTKAMASLQPVMISFLFLMQELNAPTKAFLICSSVRCGVWQSALPWRLRYLALHRQTIRRYLLLEFHTLQPYRFPHSPQMIRLAKISLALQACASDLLRSRSCCTKSNTSGETMPS